MSADYGKLAMNMKPRHFTTKLYTTFIIITLQILVISLLASYVFYQYDLVIKEASEETLPTIISALRLSEQSNQLASFAPTLAAAESASQLDATYAQLSRTLDDIRQNLTKLDNYANQLPLTTIRNTVEEMADNLARLKKSRTHYLMLQSKIEKLADKFIDFQTFLADNTDPIIDGVNTLNNTFTTHTVDQHERVVDELAYYYIARLLLMTELQNVTQCYYYRLADTDKLTCKILLSDVKQSLAELNEQQDSNFINLMDAVLLELASIEQSKKLNLTEHRDTLQELKWSIDNLIAKERHNLQRHAEETTEILSAALKELINFVASDLNNALDIKAEGHLVISLLNSVVYVDKLIAVDSLHENFDNALQRFETAIKNFEQSKLADQNPVLVGNINNILEQIKYIATPNNNNIFSLKTELIKANSDINTALFDNHKLAAKINTYISGVDNIVHRLQASLEDVEKTMDNIQGKSQYAFSFIFLFSIISTIAMSYLTSRELGRHELALRQSKDSAESANQAKSTFLANMSHELRTPLNGILGYAQILLNRHDIKFEQKEGLGIIQRSGEYLLTLINDILDLSKVEAGSLEIHPEPIIFDNFMQGISDLFEIRAEQKGISFYYEPELPLPYLIEADEKRLRQILINLLGNAVKFTADGWVKLIVRQQAEHFYFCVEDTGAGIAEDDLAHIFQPFRQVGDKRQREEGTGLGLSITHRLVSAMGGELHVSSQLGKGSQFWMTLPLVVADQPDWQVPEQLDTSRLIGFAEAMCCVLVVDDNAQDRQVLRDMLIPLGFSVLEAASAAETLGLVQHQIPSLILLDLVMPEQDGYSLARALRAFPPLANTPIIAVSASVFEHHRHASFTAGCNDFLGKPLQYRELIEHLQHYLHLTWEYATVKADAEDDFNEKSVGPSPEQASFLYELTMMGDISGILEYLIHLEEKDDRLSPFVHRLRELARTFDEDGICTLIEPYLGR